MMCSGQFKMTHSFWVCNAHQSVVLLVNAMEWDLTYKDLIKKIVCHIESNRWIMHWCEFCPGTTTLKEFLNQELNEQEDNEKFNYCRLDTTDRTILTTFTATYEEYKGNLTRHSYTES